MTEAARLRFLRAFLRFLALFFIFGFAIPAAVWPSGWTWTTGRSEYAEMIGVIYATLGVFLWIAALAIRTNTEV